MRYVWGIALLLHPMLKLFFLLLIIKESDILSNFCSSFIIKKLVIFFKSIDYPNLLYNKWSQVLYTVWLTFNNWYILVMNLIVITTLYIFNVICKKIALFNIDVRSVMIQVTWFYYFSLSMLTFISHFC